MNNFFLKTEGRCPNDESPRGNLGRQVAVWLISPLFALGLSLSSHAEITEPDTIFYGQVVNRSSHQDYLLTQGALAWTIKRPDGKQIHISTTLLPLNGGTYSYQLKVPHEALAFGLTVSSNAVPLTVLPGTCSHLQVTVDGLPAAIMAPASSTFVVSQGLRASTYRLDLELLNPLADTSGDGIPDWWKSKYNAIDPNADPDHDGWSNLQEFFHGANPTNDNRIASLSTGELFVYADGATGIRLAAIDSDSAPTNLFYTLQATPYTGALYLRNGNANPANSDLPLVAGSAFTQDDVNKGRLLFVHQSTDVSATADSFAVSLHDESHPPVTNVVTLTVYRPSYSDSILQQAGAVSAAPAGYADIAGLSFYEQQMLLNYFLSRNQAYLIWDSSRAASPQQIVAASAGLGQAQYSQYIATYGHDRHQILLAGAGGDHLAGGMENDILVAGRGTDSLRGNGGSDLFVIPGPNTGNDTIEDFNPSEGDALDISRVLTGASTSLTNYVQVTTSGTNSYLNISYNGNGANYTDMVLTLSGVQLAQDSLRGLVDGGNLITGSKGLPPRLSILANLPAASQNGPVAGQFTISRSGATDAAFTANLQISGSAVNGNDYQYITPQVVFAAGQRTATLQVNPYATSTVFTQIVQVTIVSGTGYEVGSPALAQVTVEPMLPQVSIQTLEPIASKIDQSAGLFLVTRGGVINNSVLVRLTIGGSAPASHYNPISSFLNFSAQQTTALISITPKSTATLSNGLESVQISVKADPSYRVMNPSTDRVLLVDQIMTFGLWQQKNFPGSTENPLTFAAEDTGNTGVQNLFRYAYGLNPISPQNSPRRPAYGILSDHLSVSFKRPPAIYDINYVVEVSDDLVNWYASSDNLEQYFPAASSNDLETVFFRSKSSVAGTPKSFMRVRVEFQP